MKDWTQSDPTRPDPMKKWTRSDPIGPEKIQYFKVHAALVLAGTLHLASVWSATRRSRLYSVGNANIDNFRSRCTRYRVCDAGRAEGLASQPPSPWVQVVNICVLVFLLRFSAAIFVNFKIQQLLCRFGVSIFLLRHISQAPPDE